MTDILQRLRNPQWQDHDGQADVLNPRQTEADMGAAADEIERLRNALEAIAMMRKLDECPLAAEMRTIALAAILKPERDA